MTGVEIELDVYLERVELTKFIESPQILSVKLVHCRTGYFQAQFHYEESRRCVICLDSCLRHNEDCHIGVSKPPPYTNQCLFQVINHV